MVSWWGHGAWSSQAWQLEGKALQLWANETLSIPALDQGIARPAQRWEICLIYFASAHHVTFYNLGQILTVVITWFGAYGKAICEDMPGIGIGSIPFPYTLCNWGHHVYSCHIHHQPETKKKQQHHAAIEWVNTRSHFPRLNQQNQQPLTKDPSCTG